MDKQESAWMNISFFRRRATCMKKKIPKDPESRDSLATHDSKHQRNVYKSSIRPPSSWHRTLPIKHLQNSPFFVQEPKRNLMPTIEECLRKLQTQCYVINSGTPSFFSNRIPVCEEGFAATMPRMKARGEKETDE